MIVTEPYTSRPSPACGRLDEHEPHDHTTHEPQRWKRKTLRCPGTPVTEGGQRS